MNHLFPYFERTLLRPDITISEQFQAYDDATQLGIAGLTVAPFWVKKARRELGDDHPVILSAVVGYPFGYQRTEVKQLEAKLALEDGATELELVLNTSALFSSSSVWLKIEFAKLISQAHAQERLLTVILESALLTPEQQTKMIKLAVDAGADFIKDRTGALPYEFSLDAGLAFRQAVPSSVGVKIVADGATAGEMETLVSAGVERLSVASAVW